MAPNNVDWSAKVASECGAYTGAITLTNAAECYEVTLPRWAGSVVLTPNADSVVGYSPAASIAAAGHPLVANSVTEWPVFPSKTIRTNGARICLQSAGGGTVVVVTLLPRIGIGE